MRLKKEGWTVLIQKVNGHWFVAIDGGDRSGTGLLASAMFRTRREARDLARRLQSFGMRKTRIVRCLLSLVTEDTE